MNKNMLSQYEAELLSANNDDCRWDVLSCAIFDPGIELQEFCVLAVRAGALMDDIKSGRGVVCDLVRVIYKTVTQYQQEQQKRRIFG